MYQSDLQVGENNNKFDSKNRFISKSARVIRAINLATLKPSKGLKRLQFTCVKCTILDHSSNMCVQYSVSTIHTDTIVDTTTSRSPVTTSLSCN